MLISDLQQLKTNTKCNHLIGRARSLQNQGDLKLRFCCIDRGIGFYQPSINQIDVKITHYNRLAHFYDQ